MTEAEWLAAREPTPLLAALGDRASPRKLRLFTCACCRRVEAAEPTVWDPAVLDAAERYADGSAGADELRAAHRWVGERLFEARERLEAETRGGEQHPAQTSAATRAQAEYVALYAASAATNPVGWSR